MRVPEADEDGDAVGSGMRQREERGNPGMIQDYFAPTPQPEIPVCETCGKEWTEDPGSRSPCGTVFSQSCDCERSPARGDAMSHHYTSEMRARDFPSCGCEKCVEARATVLMTHQPAPTASPEPAVWDLVLADIAVRDKMGTATYGQRLVPGDGRDSLIDAYQEALDLVAYLRKAIYERDSLAQRAGQPAAAGRRV